MTWSVMRRWSLEFVDEGMTSWMPMRRAKERQYPKVVACVLKVFCDRLLSSNELVIRSCADRSSWKALVEVRLFNAIDHEPRLFVWVVGLSMICHCGRTTSYELPLCDLRMVKTGLTMRTVSSYEIDFSAVLRVCITFGSYAASFGVMHVFCLP